MVLSGKYRKFVTKEVQNGSVKGSIKWFCYGKCKMVLSGKYRKFVTKEVQNGSIKGSTKWFC